MAEIEFQDPRRRELLTALKDALPGFAVIGSTVRACVWLSDLDTLAELVVKVQADPNGQAMVFNNIEKDVKLVQTCRL